jgi:hypothetical protein
MNDFEKSLLALASFSVPDFGNDSAWLGHQPFAKWIIEQKAPTAYWKESGGLNEPKKCFKRFY